MGSPGSKELLDDDLVQALYRVVLDPARWGEVAKEMARKAHATTPIITTIGVDRADVHWIQFLHSDVPTEIVASNLENPWATRGFYSSSRPITLTDHLLPFEELEKTPFYQECLRPYDVSHGLGLNLKLGKSEYLTVFLGRSRRDGPFAQDDVERCSRLVPHLTTVGHLLRQNRAARAEGAAALRTIDSFWCGVVVVHEDLQIVCHNQIARELLADCRVLSIADGQLRSSQGAVARKLSRLVGAACASDGGSDPARPAAVVVRHAGSGQRIAVVAAPLGTLEFDVKSCKPAAVLFINDIEGRCVAHEKVLIDMFELTPAEATVAVLVSRGVGLGTVAEQLGVKLNTVRFHIQRVFDKTDVHRQSELARLLHAIPPTRTRLDSSRVDRGVASPKSRRS